MAIGSEARSTFLAIVKGDASQAVTEFKKLGNSVEKSTKGAEGSVGKFKTFTNGAFKELKANAGMFAAGAGAAIGAFAAKAVMDFAKLGVSVGKFADATGLAAEDASRWIEVAGDIGVEAGTVEKAIGRLNRTIDPDKFRELGIAIAYTKDGATDVNGTFLNVIDRLNGMKDPAEKAALAQKLLGRGWQEMAELINQGSGTLSKSLAGVSSSKVFDAKEVARAREVRAAMDKLQDAVDDLVLTVGKELAPAFSDAANTAGELIGPLSKLFTLAQKIFNYSPTNFVAWGQRLWDIVDGATEGADTINLMTASLEEVNAFLEKHNFNAAESADLLKWYAHWQGVAAEANQRTADEAGTLNDANKENAQRMWEAQEATDAAAEATMRFKQSAQDALGRLQALNDELAGDKAAAEFRTLIGDAAEKQADLTKEFEDGKITAQEYFDQTIINSANAKQGIIDYGSEIDSLDPDVLTKIVTTYDPNNPQQTVDKIQAALDKERLYIKIQGVPVLSSEAKKLMEYGIPKDGKYEPKKGKANGGPIKAGVPYMVGERGPEMIVPNTNAMVLDAARTSRAMGGGTYNTTIVVRQVPTERELIDLINSTRRKQGAVI